MTKIAFPNRLEKILHEVIDADTGLGAWALALSDITGAAFAKFLNDTEHDSRELRNLKQRVTSENGYPVETQTLDRLANSFFDVYASGQYKDSAVFQESRIQFGFTKVPDDPVVSLRSFGSALKMESELLNEYYMGNNSGVRMTGLEWCTGLSLSASLLCMSEDAKALADAFRRCSG